MFEFWGALEGIGVLFCAEISLIEASASVGGVVDIVLAAGCDGFESGDVRSGNSAGGGYFWKKRSRRGGSDFAISTVFGALILCGLRVCDHDAGMQAWRSKVPSAKTGLSCEVALPCPRVELARAAAY